MHVASPNRLKTEAPREVTEDDPGVRRVALVAIVVAVILFYMVCLRYLLPLPVFDDYTAVLKFIDNLTKVQGVGTKIVYVLTTQHNEYKPVWSNAIEALQFKATGQVNFRVLSVIGDLQVLGIAWVLWRNFADVTEKGSRRLMLFVPVALLLFQLNYNETLNWPMPCLQNLGVILFALFSVAKAAKPDRASFAWSCAGLCAAIAASGNGFMLLPIGWLLFQQQRNWLRALVWTLLTAACAIGYAYHYRVPSTTAGKPEAGSLFHPLYILSFLGDSCGYVHAGTRYVSVFVGLFIFGIFALAVRERFFAANPAMFSTMLFVILTSLGVAVIRSGLGYDSSLASRYRIYSDLLLICCYSFIIHRLRDASIVQRRNALRVLYVLASLFWLVGDLQGTREMRYRYRLLKQGADVYRQSNHAQGPIVYSTPQETLYWNNRYRSDLLQAEKDGIYHMP